MREIPIKAIVDVEIGGKFTWHVFSDFGEAVDFEKELIVKGGKTRLNVIYGNWTYHSPD